MALQPVFKKGYIEYLKTHIEPSLYLGNAFEYDRKQVVRLYGINHPEGLLERLDPSPDGDLQSAIAIYEAYKDISPLFAQQDDLWVYLTHVDLFEYVKKRWPIKEDNDEEMINHITDHWFRNRFQFLRTTFAGLWWNVYMTKDDNRSNPYELTEYLFKNQEFRTSSFGELPLIRHKEAMIGIIEFIQNHEDLLKVGFSAKARYIRHIFNIIGGYKNLSALSRDFFKDILEKRLDVLTTIHDNREARVGAEIYNEE